MKKLFLLIALAHSTISTANIIDKDRATDMTNQTELYKDRIKSTTPTQAVVFVSSPVDATFMHFEVVTLTDNGGILSFSRPIGSFKKPIDQCITEKGNAIISPLNITIDTDLRPLRFKCIGEGGNYVEAYSTSE